jgi:hypothetical protein
VTVTAGVSATTLTVADDGWGCGLAPSFGEGMRVAGMLAEEVGGQIALKRRGERTLGTLLLPVRPRAA